MSAIQQYISQLVQQITARFSGVPPALLLFLAILAGFIALVLILVFLRLLWELVLVIFGVRRRRSRSRRVSRPVPARLYSTDWAKERERRRREFARRLRR